MALPAKGDDILVMVILKFRQNLVNDEVVQACKPGKGYFLKNLQF
jgi:hypothetical protein